MEGWKSDDPYPGYGKKYKKYNNEFNIYVTAIENATDDFTDQRDDAIDEINVMKKTLNDEFEAIPNISTTAINLKDHCFLAMDRLQNSYQMLVSEYRESNQLARSTPLPNYFKESVSLNKPKLKDFKSEMVEKPTEIVNALDMHSEELHSLFDKMISKLQSTKAVLDNEYPFKVEADHG
jgi:hypothetical protein